MSHVEQLDAQVAELMRLSPKDRVYIAERLMDSVPAVIDEESLKEYRRRLQELEDGTVEGIPADEVMAEMRRMLDEDYPLSP